MFLSEAATSRFGRSTTKKSTYSQEGQSRSDTNRMDTSRSSRFGNIASQMTHVTDYKKDKTRVKSGSSESEEEMGTMVAPPASKRVVWSPGFE